LKKKKTEKQHLSEGEGGSGNKERGASGGWQGGSTTVKKNKPGSLKGKVSKEG